jgi:GT2 family glycosyltransferase
VTEEIGPNGPSIARSRCAVVIPTFNGAHLLSTCLAALLAHPPRNCEWKVVVVDDASRDGTAERFGSYDERVTVVARQRNGGFAVACNDGARAAGEVDHLVFLNNDTVPIPGWLDALVEAAEQHPEAAAFGSRLLYPDGTIQHAGVAIGHDRWPHHLYTGFPGEHPAVLRGKRVVAATAASLLVRRDAFERSGGFDTAYQNGYEDIDFCLRLSEQGQEVRYCPASVLYHLESVTRWADEGMRHTAHNDRLFDERWRGRIAPDDVEHYLADGLLSIEYGANFPVQMSISPLLAVVRRETGPEDRIERLLSIRTKQVEELREQQTRATVRQQREQPLAPKSPVLRGGNGGPPEVVHRGDFTRLDGSPRHRVSVLMPVIDAGPALRETLPLLLEQRAAAEIEIVAADSASTDDTVEVLREFGATVLAIDPADFDHGLTRNLLASHAEGEVLVFLNQRSRPCDREWLAPLLDALEQGESVAGACSRVVPYPSADPLTQRDVTLDPSGSPKRSVKRIDDWAAYAAMPVERRRLLFNFHTVSAAIRASALRQIPLQSVRAIGEDLLWSREALEAGMTLVHEPASRVYHSHDYSLREWLMRNVDDGVANRDINDRSLSEQESDELVRGLIAGDWAYLRDELGLRGGELQRWQIHAALRRATQVAGQWLGVNYETMPPGALEAFSRVADARRRATTRTASA